MKIETKYDIGQEVWFMLKSEPICETVTYLTVYTHNKLVIEYFFEESGVFFREESLFLSKEELLKNLEYERKMLRNLQVLL